MDALRERREEAHLIAQQILTMAEKMKADDPSQAEKILRLEANTYHCLGNFAQDKDTEEGAKKAVKYLENSRDIYRAIGDTNGVSIAEANIDMLLEFHPREEKVSRKTSTEMLENCRKLYERKV